MPQLLSPVGEISTAEAPSKSVPHSPDPWPPTSTQHPAAPEWLHGIAEQGSTTEAEKYKGLRTGGRP